MIPSPGQLEAISHLREGDLSETPFAVLLHALASQKNSVVLEIERPPMKKSIILEHGVPVDCRSNILQDTFGYFLIGLGRLTEEGCQTALSKAASHGIQLGEMLILDGVINPTELYRLLQQSLAKKLLDVFTWRSGRFRILDDTPEVESPLAVRVAQLVVTGISKFALQEEVNLAIGEIVGKKLFLHPRPSYAMSEIRLNSHQQQLIDLLATGKRIDELAAETSVPFDDINRLLYSLSVIGAVVPEEWLPKGPAPEPEAPAKPAVFAAPADVPRSAAEVEVLRNQLMDAYLRHRKQDAFELLGLADDAGQVDIEQRFLEFADRFAPARYSIPELEDLQEKAEDLFLAGGRAFGELCDVERRNSLVLRRQNLQQRSGTPNASERFKIKSNLLDSELQYRRGKALMDKGNYREALQQIQFAYDCDPQNSTYRAELAYCTYLDDPKGAADGALEELTETLRIDPKSGLSRYYAGCIHAALGNRREAEDLLRQSIRAMMPDRRPIEALKTLLGGKG